MGTTAIAAQAMTATLEGLSSRAAEGIGIGLMTIVGQCIGAGLRDEAKQSIRLLARYAWFAVLISDAILAALVKPVTILAGMEPEAAKLCRNLTYLICIVKSVIWTTAFLPAYGMRAAGDARFTMAATSLTMWFCRVAIVVTLARFFHMGPIAVWIGMFADWTARSIVFHLRFVSGRWAEKSAIS